jgi:hypothetical protein
MPEQEKLEKIPGAVQASPGKSQWSDSFFYGKDGGEALTVRVKVITGHYLQLLYDGIKENRENLSNENEQTFTGLATRC